MACCVWPRGLKQRRGAGSGHSWSGSRGVSALCSSVWFAASIGGRSALACEPLPPVESRPSRGGASPPRRPPPRTTQCSGLANKPVDFGEPFPRAADRQRSAEGRCLSGEGLCRRWAIAYADAGVLGGGPQRRYGWALLGRHPRRGSRRTQCEPVVPRRSVCPLGACHLAPYHYLGRICARHPAST